MSQFVPDTSHFGTLRDKVIVLTGGASGIGAATVKLLAEQGAHVVFGDINETAAQEVAKQTTTATFVRCDVCKYEDVYALFKTAFNTHQRVDHAIACAGIFEQGNWFDPALTVESVGSDHGNTKVLDVNVLGTMYFARVAAVFLREGQTKGDNRSLTLLSSVSAFRDSPGLFMYQTSKHAIQGLLRSCRKTLYERDGIRVNAVCPGMTETPMTAAMVSVFRENNLYWQTAETVAAMILGLQVDGSMHGKAIYVEGGDAWEFEDSFIAAQPQWLGEVPTRRMNVNTEAVKKGVLLPKS